MRSGGRRKDREDGLTVERRLESPVKQWHWVPKCFIGAPNARMSNSAMSMLMRPYTLTQTDQKIAKSSCKRGGVYVFGQAVFQGEVGQSLLQVAAFKARRLHLIAGRRTGGVACKPLRGIPSASYSTGSRQYLTAADRSNAVLAAQPLKHHTNFALG